MANSRMSDEQQPGDEPFLCKQEEICADQWIAVDAGQAAFESCVFSGSSPPQKSTNEGAAQTVSSTNTLLDVLPVPGQTHAEILFRGCTISNLTLESSQLLGILNTSITPQPAYHSHEISTKWADNSSWKTYTLLSTYCHENFAGVPMCDPRAQCDASATNIGVQCHCAGQQNKQFIHSAAAVDDGHKCTEKSKADISLVSERIDLVVKKPGRSQEIKVLVSGTGEQPLPISLGAQLTHRMCGLMTAEACKRNSSSQENTTVNWAQVSPKTSPGCSPLSWYGQSFCWEDQTIPKELELNLDREKLRFEDSHLSGFFIDIDCSKQNSNDPCAADGDVLYWGVNLDSVDNPTQNMIMTVAVEALPSCDLTKVIVTPDNTRFIDHKSSRVTAELQMFDVDNQPINFSNPDLSIHVPMLVHMCECVPELYVFKVQHLCAVEAHSRWDGLALAIQAAGE